MSDISFLANSIWPNGIKVDADGYVVFYPLGTNKIEVPSEDEWPKGDKLVSPFVYEEGELVGVVDTKAMTVSGNTTITLPYEHIEADFSSIVQGDLTVNAPNATVKEFTWAVVAGEGGSDNDEVIITLKYKGCKTVDEVKAVDANYLTTDIVDGVWSEGLGDLEDGYQMFKYCDTLASFSSDLSSLTNGNDMFKGCENLTSFNLDLSFLTNGYSMFDNCTNLTTFTSNSAKLTNGTSMFYNCENLESFSSDLSSLTNGYSMFYGCQNLESFSSDLSSLTDGSSMFNDCFNLTTFNSDLSSLTNGSFMFNNCFNLTTFNYDLSQMENGQNVFSGCSKLTSFSSDLSKMINGICAFYGCQNLESFSSDLSSLTDGKDMFYKCKLNTASVQNIADTINTVSSGTIRIDIGNTPPNSQEEAAFNTMVDKGWTVYVGVNGGNSSQWNPTSLTPIDGEVIQTPIPFYAKPVQSDEEHARYIDAEGNFFDILGGNYIYGDDLSTYGMFTSEEDAAANMRLTKIGQEEIKTA